MLGLKDEKPKEDKKAEKKPAEKSSGNDEAKKILEQMEQKKDAGDCPFC